MRGPGYRATRSSGLQVARHSTREGIMRPRGATTVTNRRNFLNGMTLAGAAALTPAGHAASATQSRSATRMAQAGQGAGAGAPTAALTVQAVGDLAGSSTSYAYAIKAGPWIFLTGHEAFDFHRGPAPEVEGPAG